MMLTRMAGPSFGTPDRYTTTMVCVVCVGVCVCVWCVCVYVCVRVCACVPRPFLTKVNKFDFCVGFVGCEDEILQLEITVDDSISLCQYHVRWARNVQR